MKVTGSDGKTVDGGARTIGIGAGAVETPNAIKSAVKLPTILDQMIATDTFYSLKCAGPSQSPVYADLLREVML